MTINLRKINFEKISRFAFWFIFSGITVYALLPAETDIIRSSYDRLRLTASGFFLHMAAFSLLYFFALSGNISTDNRLRLVVWIVLYGIALEIIHYFLPYRSFNIFDIVANLSGISLIQIFYLFSKSSGGHVR